MSARGELHRGRIAKPIRILSVRALTRDDLACLKERRVGPPKVQQYRQTHHRIARLIAAGLRPFQIANLTGYTVVRIGQLRTDPAFEQLVSEYTGKVNAEHEAAIDDIRETELETMTVASRLINDRVIAAAEDPENSSISLRELMHLTADRYDRFGYGKHATQTNEVLDFAKVMEAMAAKSGRSNVIDAKANPTSAQQPAVGGFRRRV